MKFGGYNLNQAGIVCDIKLPGGRPQLVQAGPPTPTSVTAELSSEAGSLGEALGKPAMLFFGPPNDPSVVRKLLPKLRELFDVDWVDSSLDGVHAVANRSYVALIAKLGTTGNLGIDVIAALREIQGEGPLVVVHSATAAANQETQAKLRDQHKCNLIVGPPEEEALFNALHPLAVRTNDEVSSTDVLTGKPALLLFGPPNDPEMVKRLTPQLQPFFHVTHVESAQQGIEAISFQTYVACVAKLGTENNLGVDVIKAFRSAHGKEPFVAVHSSTAAADPSILHVLQDKLNVDLCVSANGESNLVSALVEYALARAQ
jgi:DNA-binding response OmpR family regulator